MKGAYKKECAVTLVSFLVCALLTHIFPMYFLFPGLMEMSIFGFPAHYFLAIFLGWVLLIPLYWIYIEVSEKVDREIAEGSLAAAEAAENAKTAGTPAGGGAE